MCFSLWFSVNFEQFSSKLAFQLCFEDDYMFFLVRIIIILFLPQFMQRNSIKYQQSQSAPIPATDKICKSPAKFTSQFPKQLPKHYQSTQILSDDIQQNFGETMSQSNSAAYSFLASQKPNSLSTLVKTIYQILKNGQSLLEAEYQKLRSNLRQALKDKISFQNYQAFFSEVDTILNDFHNHFSNLKKDFISEKSRVDQVQKQTTQAEMRLNQIKAQVGDLQTCIKNLEIRKENIQKWLQQKNQLRILNKQQLQSQLSESSFLLTLKQSRIEELQGRLNRSMNSLLDSQAKNDKLIKQISVFQSKLSSISPFEALSSIGQSLLSMMSQLSKINTQYRQSEILSLGLSSLSNPSQSITSSQSSIGKSLKESYGLMNEYLPNTHLQ